MRLIDADAMKKDLEENYAFVGFADLLNDIIEVIDEQPTADVVERKRGMWIKSNESVLRPYMCSECGALFDVDTVLGKLSWQYCPACGAEMKGDEE